MEAPQPSNHDFFAQWQLWVAVFFAGTVSQLARILSGKYNNLSVINIIAGAIGAGVASVSVVSILLATGWVKDTFAIGIAGVVGWVGGTILSAIASAAEVYIKEKFGIDIKTDDKDEPHA